MISLLATLLLSVPAGAQTITTLNEDLWATNNSFYLSASTGYLVVSGSVSARGNAFSVGGSTFVVAGGKVGVGTASPLSSLHVSKDSGASPLSSESDTGILLKSSSNQMEMRMGIDQTNKVAMIQTVENGVTTQPLAINSAGGNVGIGTTSPASKLHISSGTLMIDGNAATGLQVFGSTFVVNSGGNVGIGTASPTDDNAFSKVLDIQGTSGAAIHLRDSAANPTTKYAFLGYTPSQTYLWSFGATSLSLGTNGTERLHFDSAGAITASANSALSLSGASGNFTSQSSVTASAFYGDGSHLSGLSINNVSVDFTGSTGAVNRSSGITSVSRSSVGVYVVTFSAAFPDAYYVCSCMLYNSGSSDLFSCNGTAKTTTTINLNTVARVTGSSTSSDFTEVMLKCWAN